jgi:hypothetical protein
MLPIAVQNYILIETAAKAEIERLLPYPEYQGSTRRKAQKIMSALDRLYRMVVQKNPEFEKTHKRHTYIQIDPKESSKFDFSSIEAMLNAKISVFEDEIPPSIEQGMEFNGQRAGFYSKISLYTALNIANNNFFNNFGDQTWGPLWGKAAALENVEKKLNIN